ncbi:serine/arginine repetitive matrix protein 1-like [Rissa tridactyla]|uniref:serine/arginine repetitive matrix protein 1-like n=1 Tax=Rissa tridactyla TaxID=75485 RepID=UPI0023BA85E5|nr:serine/arginine repetitive matrix protein 1-like [Rissa tridactyla]
MLQNKSFFRGGRKRRSAAAEPPRSTGGHGARRREGRQDPRKEGRAAARSPAARSPAAAAGSFPPPLLPQHGDCGTRIAPSPQPLVPTDGSNKPPTHLSSKTPRPAPTCPTPPARRWRRSGVGTGRKRSRGPGPTPSPWRPAALRSCGTAAGLRSPSPAARRRRGPPCPLSLVARKPGPPDAPSPLRGSHPRVREDSRRTGSILASLVAGLSPPAPEAKISSGTEERRARPPRPQRSAGPAAPRGSAGMVGTRRRVPSARAACVWGENQGHNGDCPSHLPDKLSRPYERNEMMFCFFFF